PARRAVDAGLERVAPAAAQALRETPIGAAACERETYDRIRREAIVEAGGEACGGGGEVVAAEHGPIAARLVAAAMGAAPRGPALVEGRGWHGRCLEHLRIGERDVVGQRRLLGREAERGAARAAAAAAPVDERIEHQAEELVAELEGGLLGAG